jgi:hypothetical protein
MFVPSKPFQPILLFVGKSRSLPYNGTLERLFNRVGSYCDQPFVSETMWCVSNNFIENNDNSGQNVVCFYVESIRRGRELPCRETEKEEVRERESLHEKKDSMGAKIRTFSQTTNGNII